jgi:hypothetical protein
MRTLLADLAEPAGGGEPNPVNVGFFRGQAWCSTGWRWSPWLSLGGDSHASKAAEFTLGNGLIGRAPQIEQERHHLTSGAISLSNSSHFPL